MAKKKHQRPEVPLPPHPKERAESADDIWEGILCWHETNGEPL